MKWLSIIFFSFTILFHQLEASPEQGVKEKIELLKKEHPCFSYPLKNVDDIFKISGEEKVTIFGYGSLLNQESAARTLSKEAMKTYKPAIVYGYSRTFDRHVPYTKRWGDKVRPNDTAMLNLFENEGSVNGVIFEIGKDDLKKMAKREEGYDLVPVIAVPWGKENQDPQVVYTFIASTKPRENKNYTHSCINPVPGYAIASQEGAASWGEDFEKLWIESTFLSDRKTSYATWLNDPSIDMTCTGLKKLG